MRWTASNALGAALGQMGGLIVTTLAVMGVTLARRRSLRSLIEAWGWREGEPPHLANETDVLLGACIGLQEGLLRSWLQRRVLGPAVRDPWHWTVATAAGSAAGVVGAGLAAHMGVKRGTAYGLCAGAVGGLVTGIGQCEAAGRVGSARAAWVVAAVVGHAVERGLGAGMNEVVEGPLWWTAAMAAGGAACGLISGAVLAPAARPAA